MEKKAATPVLVAAVTLAIMAGFAACGLVFFRMDQALNSQRHDLAETRKQLRALDQALSNQQHDLSEARAAIIAAVHDKFAAAQTNYQTLNQQLTDIQSKLGEIGPASQPQVVHFPAALFPGLPADVPAADSVEGKLRANGKHWKQIQGPIVPGTYIQDMLRGRMNQPKGRGDIAKVVSVGVGDRGQPIATLDFGRGVVLNLNLAELSPLDLGDEVR